MSVGGVSLGFNPYGSSYSYGRSTLGSYGNNSMLNSEDWTNSANEEAEKLKENLGISDTTSTNKTNSTTKTGSTGTTKTYASASSVSGFLMGYQNVLKELETSSAKLTGSKANNVFQNYDAALARYDGSEESSKALSKAEDDVVSSMKDFVGKLNNALNYLKANAGLGSGVTSQSDSIKRSIPSEKTLAALGISYNSEGNLVLDEEKFREKLQNDPEEVKGLVGGQYGMAERVGSKATYVLDSSVDRIVGEEEASKSSSGSSTSSGSSALSSSKSMMSDSFLQFASFAKGGAYNLSNYYAVSMLNILV
ncbi:MAG: flagellar filament capping protein FliD [Hungatella sp.]|nr:flagellar filament capping protein FliD [Hungatella sp.]